MIHFDFELLKTRPKGKLADVEDGSIKITHTLQCGPKEEAENQARGLGAAAQASLMES